MMKDMVGKVLLATPSMQDSFFKDSVVLLCHHDDEGSMGLVLNKPSEITVFDVLDDLGLFDTPMARGQAHMRWGETPVYEAGPVDTYRGFVLHAESKVYDSTMCIHDDLYLTTSRDVLEALAQGHGPTHFRLLLGYAGWSAGQLEQECMENDWMFSPATHTLVFDTEATEQWSMAAASIGVNRGQLISQVGHA